MHVAYEDAEAYVAWAALSQPTETEWEAAARGGLHHGYSLGETSQNFQGQTGELWVGDSPWRADHAGTRTHAPSRSNGIDGGPSTGSGHELT